MPCKRANIFCTWHFPFLSQHKNIGQKGRISFWENIFYFVNFWPTEKGGWIFFRWVWWQLANATRHIFLAKFPSSLTKAYKTASHNYLPLGLLGTSPLYILQLNTEDSKFNHTITKSPPQLNRSLPWSLWLDGQVQILSPHLIYGFTTVTNMENENPDKAWDSVCHIYYTAKRRLCTFVNSRQIFGTLWPSANTVASHIYDTFTTFPRKTKLNVSTSQDLTLATIDTKHHHIYKLSTYYESNQIKIAILRSQLFILMDLLLWYSLISSDAYVPSVASQKYQW